MKKTTRKIPFTVETVKQLTSAALEAAVGGRKVAPTVSDQGSCSCYEGVCNETDGCSITGC